MNARQALTQLRKLIGPKAALQDKSKPSSPEQRELDRAAHAVTSAAKKTAQENLDKRRAEVLSADAEYQKLRGVYLVAQTAHEKMPGGYYHRYTAGRDEGLFFHVEADADTLAELVEKVAAKRAVKAAA